MQIPTSSVGAVKLNDDRFVVWGRAAVAVLEVPEEPLGVTRVG